MVVATLATASTVWNSLEVTVEEEDSRYDIVGARKERSRGAYLSTLDMHPWSEEQA